MNTLQSIVPEKGTASPAARIPILMYHQISPVVNPGFEKYVVTPAAFSRQMDLLVRLGYNTLSLQALVSARNGIGALPRRPVIITFDDTFRDCVDYGVPILLERKLTATFFLVAGLVGGSSQWLLKEKGFELPLSTWAQNRDLLRLGFECGSHSLTHPRLAQLDVDECQKELIESRRILENNLGCDIQHLAYPFGSVSPSVQNLAKNCGYISACSVRIGLTSMTDELLGLPRIPVNGNDHTMDFICGLTMGNSLSSSMRSSSRTLIRKLLRLHRVL